MSFENILNNEYETEWLLNEKKESNVLYLKRKALKSILKSLLILRSDAKTVIELIKRIISKEMAFLDIIDLYLRRFKRYDTHSSYECFIPFVNSFQFIYKTLKFFLAFQSSPTFSVNNCYLSYCSLFDSNYISKALAEFSSIFG